jgi:hypothetical protein
VGGFARAAGAEPQRADLSCFESAINLDPASNSHDIPNLPEARHYTAHDNGFVLPGEMLMCDRKPIDGSITRNLPQMSSIQTSEYRPHRMSFILVQGFLKVLD